MPDLIFKPGQLEAANILCSYKRFNMKILCSYWTQGFVTKEEEKDAREMKTPRKMSELLEKDCSPSH